MRKYDDFFSLTSTKSFVKKKHTQIINIQITCKTMVFNRIKENYFFFAFIFFSLISSSMEQEAREKVVAQSSANGIFFKNFEPIICTVPKNWSARSC